MMKKTIYLFVAAIVLVTSCNKDKKSDPPSVAEAQDMMTEMGSDLGSDISKAMSSEGVDAIFSAMNLMESTDAFTNKKKSSSSANGDITIADFAGTFTWDEAKGDFTVVSGTPADQIIVKFPTDTTAGATLDGLLTVTAFNMTEDIEDDGYGWVDTNYYPTRIAGTLLIDNVKIGEVDFTAAYDANGDPNSLSASVTLEPIGATASFSKTSTSYTVSESLTLSGTTVQSVSGTADYVRLTAQDEWDHDWDSVYYVSGFVHYDDIKVKGSINQGELDKLYVWNDATETETSPTIAQFNQYVDLTVYTYVDDHKMADVEFYQTTSIDAVPLQFVLTDGSILSFEEVVGPMIDEVDDAIIENFDEDHTNIEIGIDIDEAAAPLK